jgi:hypothetical protein
MSSTHESTTLTKRGRYTCVPSPFFIQCHLRDGEHTVPSETSRTRSSSSDRATRGVWVVGEQPGGDQLLTGFLRRSTASREILSQFLLGSVPAVRIPIWIEQEAPERDTRGGEQPRDESRWNRSASPRQLGLGSARTRVLRSQIGSRDPSAALPGGYEHAVHATDR